MPPQAGGDNRPCAMIAARPVRTVVRGLQRTAHLTRLALAQRKQFGWRELGIRAARRVPKLASWGREDAAPALPGYVRPGPDAVFDAIYAIGFWPGTPKRYRALNRAEELSAAGYRVHVMPFDDIDDIRRYRWRASAIVLFRAEYDPWAGIDETLAHIRRLGASVVYDIDDFVFDPDLADRIDGLRYMAPYQQQAEIKAMARRGRMMRLCDSVTVSTAPLARAVERLGCRAVIVPNSLNREQLRTAAEISAAPPDRNSQAVTIAYLSGSPTHQRDFAECETALLDIMRRHPHARFRLVGYLDLGPRWEAFGDRIERIGYLSPADLLRCIAGIDINLAPLEVGNPFCEAKSELKFFEAALVGVPTIASATEPFAAAIEDGVSGFLVHDETAWRTALELLVMSESRRAAMGEAARRRALDLFAPAVVAPRAAAALRLPPAPNPDRAGLGP